MICLRVYTAVITYFITTALIVRCSSCAGDRIYLNLLDRECAIGINPLQRASEAQTYLS